MAEQPAWIVHLEYMLSQYYKADIKIMEEFIEILSKPTHLKVTVVVKKGSLSEPEQFVYFVKLYENIVPYHIRMDLLAKFVKEVDLYTVALPAIKEFQKAGNTYALPYDQIFPSCIGARLSTKSNMPDETGVLILENLNEMGYTRPDVRAGLDLETSKLVLHKMAHLHATPLAMKFLDSDLDLFKQKIVPCLVEVKYAKEPFCYQDVDRLVNDGISSASPYLKPLKVLVEQAKEIAWRGKKYDDESWLTICHFKFSIFNIMLKYDDQNKPIACKIVDLQALNYTHLCTDLIYFLFTSVNTSVLMSNFDNLITFYFDLFTGILSYYKIYHRHTREGFLKEFDEEGPNMIIEILQMLPYISGDGYEQDGDPILGESFKKKLNDIMRVMKSRKWIEL